MFAEIFENVRQKSPLIHNITNYATVNDCAKMLLACGESPIMADGLKDAVEITAICGGLNINIGKLNRCTIPAMFAAGKRANELDHLLRQHRFQRHAPAVRFIVPPRQLARTVASKGADLIHHPHCNAPGSL